MASSRRTLTAGRARLTTRPTLSPTTTTGELGSATLPWTIPDLHALKKHLASPTHHRKLPNGVHHPLRDSSNHLESASCGFMRFDNVQRSIQGILSSDRLIVLMCL
ncbi:hypothetical protein F5Y18DRAFT_236037 [Xylariaceae sp. FL1019]|nr:hypothetical protein F5Y18DRAFT_236037 [Xylariaceae sp. FL1019]